MFILIGKCIKDNPKRAQETNAEGRNRALLVEYSAAQNSAQHHDSLVWTTIGLIWSAELVLLGFVIQTINNSQITSVIIMACVLALVLLFFLLITYFSFRNIRTQKYRRCKEIEKILNLKQHTTLKQQEKVGLITFSIVMISFITTWVYILVFMVG